MPVIDCATGAEREHTPQEQAEIDAQQAALAAEVPAAVSPRQLKLALLQTGLLDEVEAFAAAADREAQIAWEYALEFQRSDPLLNSMAESFGMSADQVDEIFRLAATL